MYYRDYRDKTDTAQLRVKGGVAWGTSIWARKKVISLAEASPGSLPGGGSIWAIFWRMSRSSLGKGLFSWMSWFSVAAAKSLQSCPTLCNPRDDSPSGSSVHGIFQARVLEWGAIAFSMIQCYTYLFPYAPSKALPLNISHSHTLSTDIVV